jgi:uncharacterized protein
LAIETGRPLWYKRRHETRRDHKDVKGTRGRLAGARRHACPLFGSVARDEQRPDSDIDILVDLDPVVVATMFDYAGLKDYVASLFQGSVDVVDREALTPLRLVRPPTRSMCSDIELGRASRLLKNSFSPQFDSVLDSVGFHYVHGFDLTQRTFSAAC